jgi:hypothetical protein
MLLIADWYTTFGLYDSSRRIGIFLNYVSG